ncbi:cell division control protein [Pelomyxa schiedti]|nr:cell division control protein [Pelomyxa schiedti]
MHRTVPPNAAPAPPANVPPMPIMGGGGTAAATTATATATPSINNTTAECPEAQTPPSHQQDAVLSTGTCGSGDLPPNAAPVPPVYIPPPPTVVGSSPPPPAKTHTAELAYSSAAASSSFAASSAAIAASAIAAASVTTAMAASQLQQSSSMPAQGSGTATASPESSEQSAIDESKPAIIVDHDGAVKMGTVEALVARLTTEKKPDPQFMLRFLLTHNAHTTPFRLLELLINRYNLQPTRINTPEEREAFIKTTLYPIRLRIFVVLETWIKKLWNSSTDPELVNKVKEFATEASQVMKMPADQLLKTIHKSVTGKEVGGEIVWDKPPPQSLLPLALSQGYELTPEIMSFHTVPIREIARQLTLIEQGIYKSIKPWELLGLAWTKKDKSLAPNVSRMIQHFNKISNWVYSEITAVEDLQMRIRTLERCIELAENLERLQNFNALMEVISGLTNSCVFRLKKTWAGISSHHSKIFEAIRELTDNSKNNQIMRNRLKNIHPPCIPYLGIFLTDLTFIEEGNQTFIEDKVNFFKCTLQANVIIDVQQYQQQPYCLREVQPIIDWILTRGCTLTEEICYKRSVILEPKEKSPEDNKTEPSEDGPPPEEELPISMLFPYELEPTLVKLPVSMTIGAACRLLFDRWKAKKPPAISTPFFSKFLSQCNDVSLLKIVVPQPHEQAFMLEEHQRLGELVSSLPSSCMPKKGNEFFFALLPSPEVISCVYITERTCEASHPLIDCNAPLGLMIPLLQIAFGTTENIILAYYENESLVQWVNCNLSFAAQRLGKGTLVVIAVSAFQEFVQSEEEIRTRGQSFNAGEWSLSGILRITSSIPSSVKAAHMDLLARGRKVVKEKGHWTVMIDGLLVYYAGMEDAIPKHVLPIQYFDVQYVREGAQLCILMKPILPIKEFKPFILCAPQEELTRTCFSLFHTHSRVNEKTRQFGISLSVIAARPGNKSLVPSVLRDILNWLHSHSIYNERLFSGEANGMIIEKYKSQFDSGIEVDLGSCDSAILGELVCVFLSELPEPLLTYALYPKFLHIAEQLIRDQTNQTEIFNLGCLMGQLPLPNYAVITFLVGYLHNWVTESKVDILKVAQIFGLMFLRPPSEVDTNETIPSSVMLTLVIIKCHEQILSRYDLDLWPQFHERFGESYKTPPTDIHLIRAETKKEILYAIKEAKQKNSFGEVLRKSYSEILRLTQPPQGSLTSSSSVANIPSSPSQLSSPSPPVPPVESVPGTLLQTLVLATATAVHTHAAANTPSTNTLPTGHTPPHPAAHLHSHAAARAPSPIPLPLPATSFHRPPAHRQPGRRNSAAAAPGRAPAHPQALHLPHPPLDSRAPSPDHAVSELAPGLSLGSADTGAAPDPADPAPPTGPRPAVPALQAALRAAGCFHPSIIPWCEQQ